MGYCYTGCRSADTEKPVNISRGTNMQVPGGEARMHNSEYARCGTRVQGEELQEDVRRSRSKASGFRK